VCDTFKERKRKRDIKKPAEMLSRTHHKYLSSTTKYFTEPERKVEGIKCRRRRQRRWWWSYKFIKQFSPFEFSVPYNFVVRDVGRGGEKRGEEPVRRRNKRYGNGS
jgi:hypothetical protein